MNIDTIALQCFIAVIETGSLTKAAMRVGRTQSAISQQMTKLESMVGHPLFYRGKSFTLTQQGKLFLDYAHRIYGLHREMIERFKEPELQGEFRFGMPEDFASFYLSDVLVAFSRIHPRVFVNVECDLTLNLYDRFKNNEFDMVLLKMHRPDNITNSVDVYSEKLKWVHHAGHVLDFDKPISLILSPQPCVYRERALAALNAANIKWRVVFSSPSHAGKMAAVKAGLGVTVLPRTMIPDQTDVVSSADLPPLEDAHICLLKQGANHPALLTFEKFVLSKLKH